MQAPSSSSSASITGKFKTLQATAYAKVDARYDDCIPVMVSITALPGTMEECLPMDLVVVLHIRKGRTTLPNNWEDLIAEAMATIVRKLGYSDRLAVIPGKSTLVTPKLCRADQHQLIITSQTTLTEDLESAESILYGRQDMEKKTRTGCIIIISNSNDDIDSLLSWRLRSVHAFGFRDAHNARTMHSISSSRDCSYAVLDDERGRITQAFSATVTRITSAAAAVPVEVKLMCEQTVVLRAISIPGVSYYISYDDKAAIMWPRVHMAGVTTNIVVYLDGLIQPKDLPQLLEVHLKYGTVSEKLDVQLVRKGSVGSKEVAAEIVRMEAVEIVTGVTAEDKCEWELLHAAADDLHGRWDTLLNSNCGREAAEAGLISGLVAQMREMEARLYNNYYWLEYMLSWQSHQKRQLPLPQPFMDSQSTTDPLLQLRILAKADGYGLPEHQKGLPVMVRVMAPETALAMVRRASVDLILVIDASYGAKEKQKKTQERLHLLAKAQEVQEQQDKAQNKVVQLEESLKALIKAMAKEEEKNETLEMEGKLTLKWQKIWMSAPKTKEIKMKERLKFEAQITQKRREMSHMDNEINTLRQQAMDLEKDVKRLDLLTKAIELVTKKLSVKDRLAIIPVQSSATEPATGLLVVSKQGRIESTTKVLKALHWMEQKTKAMTLIRNCLHSGPSSSTATPRPAKSSGTTFTTAAHSTDVGGSTNMLHKALMYAMKILDDRRGEEKDRRLGSIIVISDNDDDSICTESLSPNYMVHAFGFYGMHNTRALYHIASSSNGIYNVINNERDQITEAFTSCINKMTSTISVDTKVEIMCTLSSDVALSTIESAQFRYPIGKFRKSCSIFVGAISAGTVKNFIIYVENVRKDDYDNISKYIAVRVKWMNALNEAEELNGQVVVVKDGFDGYDEVVENIAHAEAVKIASYITDPNNHGKKKMAAILQQMCIKCPEFARSAGDNRIAWLASQTQKIDENWHMEVTDPNGYKNMVADKLSYILSWLSYQRSYCWITII
ncbi:unnamed protein product [Urochloa decumbens]|uniref:VWFA domain-containing protein n=1 Tax=Urochloa decumbens TaxID=240449 RepID=A0ABC9CZP5_9POAL